MALYINTIKQASPKANQVATEQYVDTSIAGIDVTQDISANNDIFAQKLGYLNYASMVAAASSGQTIINGGYVNTSLLQTNSIVASKINTVGLIAENISANEIVGKNITGGLIRGARIEGAVIMASYLDLDGQLEVLTNYHITVSMYNANPSLYTDAISISGSNEYRIPSLSMIRESTVGYYITYATTIYGLMSSYNTANAGNNLKAVKVNPSFLCTSQFSLFTSVCSDTGSSPAGTRNHFILSLNGVNLLTYVVSSDYGTTYVSISGTYFATKSYSFPIMIETPASYSYTLDIGFALISLSFSFVNGSSTVQDGGGDGSMTTILPNTLTVSATVLTGEKVLPFNWTSGRITFQQVTPAASSNVYTNGGFTHQVITGYTTYNLNQSLAINNML